MIELRLLGGAADLQGVPEGRAHALLSQSKHVALLAYLVLATPRGFHHRDRLVGLLWPELDQEHARTALRKALHGLRQALGDGAVVTRGDAVGLAPNVVWCDAVEFDEKVDAQKHARAIELYRRGHLLPGFFIPEADEFEDWLARERSALRDKAAAAAWALATLNTEDGQRTIAGRYAEYAVALAPHDEQMLRRVMTLLFERLGKRAAALAVYEDFVRRMKRDFDAEPSAETQALAARIRAA